MQVIIHYINNKIRHALKFFGNKSMTVCKSVGYRYRFKIERLWAVHDSLCKHTISCIIDSKQPRPTPTYRKMYPQSLSFFLKSHSFLVRDVIIQKQKI
jgi:hypothetical protein